MKIQTDDMNNNTLKGGNKMLKTHDLPGGPIPPHERKGFMHIEFDETDWAIMENVFEDEDTAMAAVEIIRSAPPEIQILTLQIMDMIKEVD